jgi:hypothetical protein
MKKVYSEIKKSLGQFGWKMKETILSDGSKVYAVGNKDIVLDCVDKKNAEKLLSLLDDVVNDASAEDINNLSSNERIVE